MLLKELTDRGLAHPPLWLPLNTAYLCIMGSTAYGVSTCVSDMDLYGICLPPKSILFPHTVGVIQGFDKEYDKFHVWQEHEILDRDAVGGKGRIYDFQVYSIISFFDLCRGCNPNLVDAIFVPENCILHSTKVGDLIRANRHIFLSKGVFTTFKEYAYAQLRRMENKVKKKKDNPLNEIMSFEAAHGIPNSTTFEDAKNALEGKASPLSYWPTILAKYHEIYSRLLLKSKRYEAVKIYGYDPKFAYHIVRLINECQQILEEGTIDLQRSKEQLKDIRRGEWSMKQIRDWFESKEKDLSTVHANCNIIPQEPDNKAIKQLLLNCLEEHYGKLDNCVVNPDKYLEVINDIKAVLMRHNI